MDQIKEFCDADGYQERAHWTEDGWNYVSGVGKRYSVKTTGPIWIRPPGVNLDEPLCLSELYKERGDVKVHGPPGAAVRVRGVFPSPR